MKLRMTENFKKVIVDWEQTQRKIKEVNAQIQPFQQKIRLLKDKSDQLEKSIVSHMQRNQMGGSKIEIGDVMITLGESKRTESVNRDYLLKRATEFLQNDKLAKKLVDYVYDKRSQTVTPTLRRKQSRKKGLKP